MTHSQILLTEKNLSIERQIAEVTVTVYLLQKSRQKHSLSFLRFASNCNSFSQLFLLLFTVVKVNKYVNIYNKKKAVHMFYHITWNSVIICKLHLENKTETHFGHQCRWSQPGGEDTTNPETLNNFWNDFSFWFSQWLKVFNKKNIKEIDK